MKQGSNGDQIDIYSLGAGIYVIKINDGTGENTKKLEVVK
jgi:hypothetical protein